MKNSIDYNLIEDARKHAENERLSGLSLLHTLLKIERRKSYCLLKYQSLAQFCERDLKISRSCAYRKIAAMKLLKEFPEIEAKIRSGDLSVTHLDEIDKVFKHLRPTKEHKLKIIEALSGTTTREAERIIAEIDPQLPQRDRIRQINETEVELHFTAPIALRDNIENLRDSLAHTTDSKSLGTLLLRVTKDAIEQRDKAKNKKTTTIKKLTLQETNHTCSNCGSKYAVQTDHITPKSLGGPDTRENLRPLCRNCNYRAGVELLGVETMESRGAGT